MAELVFHPPMPLSQSPIWELNRRWYAHHGSAAWSSGRVPKRASTHEGMAAAYASIIRAFVEEQGPAEVLELGAGDGSLAAGVMRQLNGVPIRYTMAESGHAVIEDWWADNELGPLLRRGRMRSSQQALLSDGPLPGRPTIVLANYLFDALAQDAWARIDGRTRPVHVQVGLPADVTHRSLDPFARIELRLSIGEGPADPHLESLDLAEGSVLCVPVAAGAVLRNVVRRRRGPLLVLAADRGRRASQPRRLHELSLTVHGSLSMAVDFELLCADPELVGAERTFVGGGAVDLVHCALGWDTGLRPSTLTGALQGSVNAFRSLLAHKRNAPVSRTVEPTARSTS